VAQQHKSHEGDRVEEEHILVGPHHYFSYVLQYWWRKTYDEQTLLLPILTKYFIISILKKSK
jgi:hypothetical protein